MVSDPVTEDNQRSVEAAAKDCQTLRWCFFVLALGAFVYSISTCQWKARLTHPNGGTIYLRLQSSPLWSPPVAPGYSEFVKKSDSLKGTPAPSWPATVSPELTAMFLTFTLLLWPIVIFTSVIYSTLRRRHHDLVLQMVWWTAVSMTVSSVLCILPWLILGGWGPPAPGLFAFIGLIAGPGIAALRQDWSGRAGELLAEKRHRSR